MIQNQHLNSKDIELLNDLFTNFIDSYKTIFNTSKGEQQSIYSKRDKLISSIEQRFETLSLTENQKTDLKDALTEFKTSLNEKDGD